MHICFLTNEYPHLDYPHGGVGTFVQTLARALVKQGMQVSVVGINYAQQDLQEEDEGVQVYRMRSSSWRKGSFMDHFRRINRQLKNLHQENPLSVVESTELGLAFIKKIPGVRYVIRMHGGHHFFTESENRGVNWWKGYQEKKSFAKADIIFGVSEYVLNHTSEYLHFKNKRGPVVFNPTNVSKFYEANSSKKVAGRIFFAGSLCEKKGIRQLILAMPKIKKIIPEAHLFVAGRDTKLQDGSSYLSFLKNHIESSIADSILFLGSVPNTEIPKYIEESEVCVYPSHMEAMPLAWIEVLSMGKAFIGSNLGPGQEVVKDGQTGLLCNPFDPDDIAKKVVQLLTNDELAAELGKNARLDALERFSIEKIVQQNINFYQALIQN